MSPMCGGNMSLCGFAVPSPPLRQGLYSSTRNLTSLSQRPYSHTWKRLAMRTRVLISGASRGIGRAIAIALAAQGYEIGINYLQNHTAAQETLETITAAGGSAYL